MKITKIIALVVIVATAGVAMTQAQSLRNADPPAEFPPSSYKSTQYVDSRGCVYVRAGISGDVTWIPRVTRSRKQLCGQTPSIAGAVASAQPRAKAADKPIQITLDAPVNVAPTAKTVAKAKVAAAPKPRRVSVAGPAAARKPVTIAASPVVIRPAAKVAQPKVVSVQPQTSHGVSACSGASATSQRYLGKAAGRLAVRCGPQARSYSTARRNVPAIAPGAVAPVAIAQQNQRVVTSYRPQVAYAGTATINGATRIVPKHVLANRQNAQNLQIPDGYRPVWTDDRLNPNRAEQSIVGQGQIKLVWTNTVPRRLINKASGRDVTASTPLVYPYVDMANQTRNLGSVSIVQRNGQVVKRIVRSANATRVRLPVVSSRSAPVVKSAANSVGSKAAAAQFVNVGTFDQKGSAQTVAQRIKRMGLPVRIGKYTRSGKTYRMVLVGPFGADASRVLSKLRSAGYRNAVLR
jgi:hypothetical protein